MANRKILQWPDKKLNQKSSEASIDDLNIFQDLRDTFRVCGGYGLAAPQIGYQKRVIVVNEKLLSDGKLDECEKIMINPEIVFKEEKYNFKEACFSVAGEQLEIERSNFIKFKFLDLNGNQIEKDASGYYAACIQHEIDHLDGKFIIDRLSNLKKRMFLKKKKKIALREKREKYKKEDDPRPGFRQQKRSKN